MPDDRRSTSVEAGAGEVEASAAVEAETGAESGEDGTGAAEASTGMAGNGAGAAEASTAVAGNGAGTTGARTGVGAAGTGAVGGGAGAAVTGAGATGNGAGYGAGEVEEPAFGLARGAGPEGTGFRFAAVGALLIVVLFAGYGLGRLNNGSAGGGGLAVPASPATPSASPFDESQPHVHGATVPVGAVGGGAAVGGLSLSGNGLTLTPLIATFDAGRSQRLDFTINGPNGAPVTTYAVVHDRPLHLILIRRDLTGFQHLHPVMAADGTWSVDITLAQPGSYRMIADFTALFGGERVTTSLGSDLTVAGDYTPLPVADPVRAATTDGFTVGYEGTPATESTQPLLMTVTDGAGNPVTVEPYLGAFGHLVVLRQGDLGYVHVHPETQLVDGKVKFWLAAPSPGTYRMFFDFQVAGKVSTAAWTVVVS